MEITVLHNQSILDISIMHTGTVENAFRIAKANNIPLSEKLESGTSLLIPSDVLNDRDVLNYYKSRTIQPATALTEESEIVVEPRGIGYMEIGKTFIVS